MAPILEPVRRVLLGKGSLTDFGDRYPVLDRNGMSSVEGLFVAGNIAGTPDIRSALNAGTDVARHIERELTSSSHEVPGHVLDYDVIIVGAGPAGMACAATLDRTPLRAIVLERTRCLATLRAFKPDLKLYDAVTGDPHNRSPLPFGGKTSSSELESAPSMGFRLPRMQTKSLSAGELLATWKPILDRLRVPVEEKVKIEEVVRSGDHFEVRIQGGRTLTARRVVLAVGKLIQLEKLAPGQEKLDCRLVEHSVAKSGEPKTSTECDVIGRSRIRMEREMDTKGIAFALLWVVGVVSMYLWLYYGKTDEDGRQILPFTNVALEGWKIYSTTYTAILWVFGIRAIRRWRSPLQTRKFSLLIASQTLLFWALPLFIFPKLAGFSTPASGYELAYIWPLAIKPENTRYWFNSGGWAFAMFAWNMLLSFALIPIITRKHGKKYCSWVCGCGGLAETLGDRWRNYSPKGKTNQERERQGLVVTGFALGATLVVLANVVFPSPRVLGEASGYLTRIYGGIVDVWLIGIIPVSLYPFLGGKIWCRFWCPSAVYMQLWSRFWKRRAKQPQDAYGIHSRKERCIACNQCTRFCEVGIDVRKFAVKGLSFDNESTSCIGCAICISVCPTDTLSFQPWAEASS